MISGKKITQEKSSLYKIYKNKSYKAEVTRSSDDYSQYFFFQNSSVPSLIVAANSIITKTNAAGAALFGLAADELINLNFKHFIPKGFEYILDNLISKTLHSKSVESCFIVLNIGNSNVPVQVKSAAIPHAFECVFEVIRQAESSDSSYTERTNASGDKLISAVAHDLKNPFNSILGFSELLLKNIRNYSYDDIERFVGIISETSKRTYNLLENLILWTRSQTGTLEFNPDTYALSSVVQENIENIGTVASEKQLTVQFKSRGEFPVFVDKKLINIVFVNILGNAVKYSYPDGLIYVEVFEEETRYGVIIKDYGVGMEPATLEKLFQMENKFSMPGTRQERGSGMGLLISKKILAKHNGNIEVSSEYGKGTSVFISLPRI